jgi:G3E family GTPase
MHLFSEELFEALNLCCRQIAGSDVILINKVDLVELKALEETETTIKHINPAAPIHKTVKGEIDLKHIIGISAFRLPPSELMGKENNPHVHSDDCDHSHDAPQNHYEIRGISSLQVSCGILDRAHLDKLDEWIRTALWENRVADIRKSEIQVLRCKGAFTSNGGVHYVLQGVRSMYEISEVQAEDSMGIPDSGKIVLIGKGLDDSVRKSLERVFA